MAEGFQRRQLFQPTGVNTQAAAVHEGLADILSSWKTNRFEPAMNDAMAELGARHGIEAGRTGDGGPGPGIGAYGRARRDAFMRAYTLDVYADTEADFLRLEQEARNDPDLFERTASKRRDAILAEVRPEAVPFIRASMDERIASARTRITAAALAAQDAAVREQTMRGLDAVRRDASRQFTSGTPDGTQRGVEFGLAYHRLVNQAVADGIFSEAEGGKLFGAAMRANAIDMALGQFEQAASTPGGDPLAVIKATLDSDDPNFDDDTRQSVGAEMMRRLAQKQTLATAAVAADRAEVQARWAASEQEATIRLLNGTLTDGWLVSQVRANAMDPALARTLQAADRNADGTEDDPQAVLDLAANWRSMTVHDVLAMPGLSAKTRAEYVGKIATKEADWRDSDPMREARARIDRELGTSDVALGLASDEVKAKRNVAMTALDRRLDALPPEERELAAIEEADRIVTDVLRGQKVQALEAVRARRARTVARVLEQEGVDSIEQLDTDARAELDKALERQDKAAEKLRSELGQ